MPQISLRIPSWLLDAVDEEAHQRDTRSDNWSRSRIVRESLKKWLSSEEIDDATVAELEGHLSVTTGPHDGIAEIEITEEVEA